VYQSIGIQIVEDRVTCGGSLVCIINWGVLVNLCSFALEVCSYQIRVYEES
jgi:hypothetical protein